MKKTNKIITVLAFLLISATVITLDSCVTSGSLNYQVREFVNNK